MEKTKDNSCDYSEEDLLVNDFLKKVSFIERFGLPFDDSKSLLDDLYSIYRLKRLHVIPSFGHVDAFSEKDVEVGLAFAAGFEKAFWFVLAEISRKTSVEEILSWFANRNAFAADSLYAFEIPDYDAKLVEQMKGLMASMKGREECEKTKEKLKK